MITKEEIGALLLFVSAFDNRTIGRADVEAWHAVALEGRWPSFDVARRAAVKHQTRRPDDRIRPGHIAEIIRELRSDASRSFTRPTAPDEIRDVDEREAWGNERAMQWFDDYFAAWAAGDDNPGVGLRQRREIEGAR